jgi:hypothetical protein
LEHGIELLDKGQLLSQVIAHEQGVDSALLRPDHSSVSLGFAAFVEPDLLARRLHFNDLIQHK